jgi:hypothetical protein
MIFDYNYSLVEYFNDNNNESDDSVFSGVQL